MVENRFVGLRSRGVYETPGGTVLHAAHRAVESITMDREVMHERDRLAPRFAELIYNGFWYAPEMEFLRAAIDASQRGVTGEARVRLYKGSLQITGRRSPVSRYSMRQSSFDEAGGYDQRDAGGFIRLQGLRLAHPRRLEATRRVGRAQRAASPRASRRRRSPFGWAGEGPAASPSSSS